MIRTILQQYRDESAFNRDLGDRFELPIVVQNTGDRPLRVELALRAANATLAAHEKK